MGQINRVALVLSAVVALFLLYSRADAGMYRCVDRSGAVSFTNAPASDTCRPLDIDQGGISLAKPSAWIREASPDFPGNFNTDTSLYDQHIKIICFRYGVDPYLVKAIIRAESDFDRNAISSQGARGLMQLMPGTARDLRVNNPFDPRENIDGGVRYLRMILDSFNNNLPLSLAAYNAGPNLVKRYQKIPDIPETIEYVKRVLVYYGGYRRASLGRISMPSTVRVREMVTVN